MESPVSCVVRPTHVNSGAGTAGASPSLGAQGERSIDRARTARESSMPSSALSSVIHGASIPAVRLTSRSQPAPAEVMGVTRITSDSASPLAQVALRSDDTRTVARIQG
jgi:hypothetical protein